MNKKDAIIPAAGLITAALIFIIMKFVAGNGGTKVKVTVDGKEYAVYKLSKDAEYDIEGYAGLVDRLTIKDGKAYMKDAACPDKLCVHMGKISSKGEIIVCLPARIVVEIVEKGDEGYDSVAN